ncbi:diguanylate cyclase (GGDEF)-like protein [Anoxybacillus tepidamans]|uniref:Diguanylate cyclase (GGDEF)-like protein n=1 Tax=Anoxybacteroides tepidamans TaxID=265948 RepID=A0A7W8MTZ3_9BACL|nr:diguanylate cyclase [Anoxybacillus tepidamans]MBB5323323.1 diguanylate cyclase (GGDEF)-like protein [Anoxybacillus tepidamans]
MQVLDDPIHHYDYVQIVSRYVTISLGVATMKPHVSSDIKQLIALADEALYKAKQNGRNRIGTSFR